ncbi:MAG TPA: tetratricopeptide repeat protein [Planctomycetota bacterium]|nr:tetratricopeptide repeat protein [Planctomycetota bacterium]
MAAALRKLPVLILALSTLGACTFWTRDMERLCDQTGRDFLIDPDKTYNRVNLGEVMANPTSFMLSDIRFHAIINRRDESVFLPMYTTFRQQDYYAFSAWPADARLWEASDRLRSLPTLFMRKENPGLQHVLDSERFALVEIRARVMGDYDQMAWIEVFYVDPVTPVLYTEQSLTDYRLGMEAVAAKDPAKAVAKLEAAVKQPLAPKVRTQVRLTLGKLYEARGDYERAAFHYDLVLTEDEKNSEAWDGWDRCEEKLAPKRAAEGKQPQKK